MFAGGSPNTFLQTDTTNLYLSTPQATGEARLSAWTVTFPGPSAGKVRVQGQTGAFFGSGVRSTPR